jgi:hypothetical protein
MLQKRMRNYVLVIESKWTMTAEPAQYRESLAIDRAIESDPEALRG